MPRQPRYRAWCFTINNPSPPTEAALLALGADYLVFGRERAGTGTPHLQGYIRLKHPCTFSSIKERLPHGAHIEVARGSAEQNRRYCTKEDDYEEVGTCPQQGHRSDLDRVKELLDDGASTRDIADQHFSTWVRNRRAFDAYRSIVEPQRNWRTQASFFWVFTG